MKLDVTNAAKITSMTAKFFDGTGFISGGSGHGNVDIGKNPTERFKVAQQIVNVFRKTVKGKDSIELGGDLVKQHFSKGTIAGNCAEMSFVASYLVLSHNQAIEKEIYCVVQQATNFGHQYCLVQEGGAEGGFINSSAIVLDPWFGVATTFGKYKEEVKGKLNDWLNEGRRINTGKSWADPKHKDVMAVLDAKPSLHHCRKKIT